MSKIEILNPYNIIKQLQQENKELEKENEDLKRKLEAKENE